MSKLLFLSLIIMTFVIPMRAARSQSPVTGLRRAITGMAAWIAIYVGLMSFINPS